MKKLKILLVVAFLFLLSGCDATYEININDGNITENLKVIETDKSIFDKTNDSGWTVRDAFNSFLNGDEFAEENYDVKSLNTDDQLGLEYSSSSSESVMDLSLLNQCYANPTVEIYNGIVTLDTGDDFECYEYYDNLNNIKVILNTNHKVISTNAEVLDDGSYIWNITKDGSKRIKISYYESNDNNSIDAKTITVIVAALVIIGIAIFFMYRKMKNKNKI